MDGFKFWMVFTPPPERDSVPWDPTVQPNWYWERPTLVRSNDGLNWQKTADYANPLLVPGNGTDWDASWLADPDLVYAPGKGPNGESWFLYYNGVNADPSISQSSIGVALSSDGKHFTKYSGNPIMPSYTRCPTVVYDAVQGQFKAWYNWGMYEVGFATSTDGVHWSPLDGDWGHVVLAGTPGSYDQGGISHMDVIKQGSDYLMYFLAMPTSEYSNMVIGRALSSDGVSWVKDPNPVLRPGDNPAWNFWHNNSGRVLALYRASPVVVGAALFLYYGGIDTASGIPGAFNYDTGLAFSTRFSDVDPFHWAFREIDAVGAAGISSGCGNHNYCPGNLASRKEVSVFIIAGMGESGSGVRFNQYFDDIANDGYAPFINRMKELGITSGCAVRRFCPDSPATRKEVAVFVISAMGERPSLAPFNAYFDDIANDGFAHSINRVFELRITAGCATRRYCPSTAVDRASMAVFAAEAFLW